MLQIPYTIYPQFLFSGQIFAPHILIPAATFPTFKKTFNEGLEEGTASKIFLFGIIFFDFGLWKWPSNTMVSLGMRKF